MPLTTDARDALLGVATGASASSPTHQLPLLSGLPVAAHDLELTSPASPLLVAQSAHKSDARWEASLSIPVLPASIGAFIKGILWSESASSTVHTFTPGTSETWLTLFSKRPGALYEKWTSGAVESLAVTAERGSVLTADVGMVGMDSSVLGSAFSGGTSEDGSAPFLPTGATLAAAWTGSSPATRPSIIRASARLSRPALAHPDFNTPKRLRIDRGTLEGEVSLTLLYTDADAYRAAFYGSTSGSTLSATVGEGAVSLTFVRGSDSLAISMPRVAWTATPTPASGDGGSVRVDVEGLMLRPSSGEPVTMTLDNAQSATY